MDNVLDVVFVLVWMELGFHKLFYCTHGAYCNMTMCNKKIKGMWKEIMNNKKYI
jgi:hypothetical protein